jgi:hypothetical protein
VVPELNTWRVVPDSRDGRTKTAQTKFSARRRSRSEEYRLQVGVEWLVIE